MSASIPQTEHDRTVSHVNKDHAEDLSLYLRHFNGVSIQDAADAQLVLLDLERMLIRAGPSRTLYKVAYSPPLTSWADRRAVLVEMSRAAAAAAASKNNHSNSDNNNDNNNNNMSRDASALPDPDLSRADTGDLIPQYTLKDVMVDAFMVLFFAGAASSYFGYIAPRTLLWSNPLLARFPGGPAGFVRFNKMIAGPTVAIHVVEVAVMATRLRKYGIRFLSSAGLFWSFSVFLSGVAAFSRFNRMINIKKLEAAAKGGKKN